MCAHISVHIFLWFVNYMIGKRSKHSQSGVDAEERPRVYSPGAKWGYFRVYRRDFKTPIVLIR
jgi:hypothetical protein